MKYLLFFIFKLIIVITYYLATKPIYYIVCLLFLLWNFDKNEYNRMINLPFYREYNTAIDFLLKCKLN